MILEPQQGEKLFKAAIVVSARPNIVVKTPMWWRHTEVVEEPPKIQLLLISRYSELHLTASPKKFNASDEAIIFCKVISLNTLILLN